MIEIKNKQVYSTEDKPIHRIGTDSYFKRCMALPTDTEDMFEEVDEIPKYTKAEYDAKVRELIKARYSVEDEIALINNSRLGNERYNAEYEEYLAYRNECKLKAKEELSNGEEV